MVSKRAAVIFSCLLASPFVMASKSLADSGHRRQSGQALTTQTISKTELEAETKDRTIGAELEAEYKNVTGSTGTFQKFNAEFEIIDPNNLGIIETTTGLAVFINDTTTPSTCAFTNPGTLEQVIINGQIVQTKVEFRGSIQSSTVNGVTTITAKGLDCGTGVFPTVAPGDPVQVLLNTTPILTGTFANDD